MTSAPDSQTITLSGEADLQSAPRIEAAFKDASVGEHGLIVVDLRRVTFIDSSGLHALIAGNAMCRGSGHELKIVACPGNVQRLFELTGLNDVLPICVEEPAPESEPPRAS